MAKVPPDIHMCIFEGMRAFVTRCVRICLLLLLLGSDTTSDGMHFQSFQSALGIVAWELLATLNCHNIRSMRSAQTDFVMRLCIRLFFDRVARLMWSLSMRVSAFSVERAYSSIFTDLWALLRCQFDRLISNYISSSRLGLTYQRSINAWSRYLVL